MKTFIKLTFFCFAFFSFSCSDEFEENNESKHVKTLPKVKVVTVNNNSGLRSTSGSTTETMLQFNNEEDLAEVKQTLSLMDASEQQVYMDELVNGFQSMKSRYEDAMLEAESYYDRAGGYEEFKAKYPEFYFPEYEDDFGAYLPVKQQYVSNLVNEYGNVMVGNQIIHEQQIINYEDLQETGLAYYDEPPINNPEPPTSSNSQDFVRKIYAYNLQPVNSMAGTKTKIGGEAFEHRTGWKEVGNGKKIKVTFGKVARQRFQAVVLYWGSRMEWHIEVSFRKKGFLGRWYNYSSVTTTSLGVLYDCGSNTPVIPNVIKSWNSSGTSSHDHYVVAKCYHINTDAEGIYKNANVYAIEKNNVKAWWTRWIYDIPAYTAFLTITYRGMPDPLKLSFRGPQMWGFYPRGMNDGTGDKLFEDE